MMRRMSTSPRARATHRTLADQRISEVTYGVAVLGLVGTLGFGWLAANTYAGTGSASGASAPQTDTGSGPATTNGGSTTTRSGSGSGSSSTGSSLGGSSGSISRSSRHAHVTTGSS